MAASSSASQQKHSQEEASADHLEGSRRESRAFCVTGATGYIGSYLVKTLLQRGYKVHATFRDPGKASRLLSLWNGGKSLKVFRADMKEEGSFDEAVKGCDGVFHLAASMDFGVVATENVESYVQSSILEPAINGTLNLLKACWRTKSVRRVIFTSSVSTITAKDDAGKWRSVVDECCQNPIDQVWNMKANGWVYVLSKLLSEKAAFEFAEEKGIDLVSIIPTTVSGPYLSSTVPASVQVLLSPITGDSQFYSILQAVHSRLGSISLVHIEDICNAHIFLMERAAAEGRYICSAGSFGMSDLVDHLAMEYPSFKAERFFGEHQGSFPSKISSQKLIDLGFEYEYSIEETIQQTVNCCLQNGFLNPRGQNDGCVPKIKNFSQAK